MKLTIVWVFLIGLIQCHITVATSLNWRTVSHCTIANGNNNNGVNQAQQQSIQSNNQLELSCGDNDDSLLYIAWSHHGFRTATTSSSTPASSVASTKHSCAFDAKSVDDCMVRVDYVANECNGLSRCQISLDSHYLHSCKAYSHYLFIVYQCIPKSRTFDICQQPDTDQQHIVQHIGDDTFYLRSPLYPDEYATNLNCQLELKSQLNTSLEIEVLEFDMEEVDTAQKNSVESAIRMLNSNRATSQKASSLACQRDYLSIGAEQVRLCGNLSPFTTILNVVGSSNPGSIASDARTSFKFYSDDALTRRGFWLKLKASNLQWRSCPPGFILINHVCLRIYDQELSWYEAHNFCSKSGYSLALIDTFELDKQLNRVLFDSDVVVSSLFNLTKSSTSRFWTGIRHLNESHWFDYKNDPIRFKWDEATWWPWLVVDPTSYSQGSCVAKRSGAMFLDDCYKRMPFACQLIVNPSSSISTSVEEAANETSSWTVTVPQVDMVVVSGSGGGAAAQEPLISTAATAMVTGSLDNHVISNDLKRQVKSSISSSDSSLIIALVCLILVLIASVNTVVVVIFCKKRKLLMKHELKNSVDQMEEKGCSNQSGSNSSTNSSSNSSSSSGGFTAILPYTSNNHKTHQPQDLSNSLSYHCLSNNTASSSTMIHPNLNKHQHHQQHHRTLRHQDSITTTTDNEYNSYNYLHSNPAARRSCMFVPIQYQNNTSLHQLKASMTANNMIQQQKQPSAIDTTTCQQDPLAHIYETISISSNFNVPPNSTFYPNQRAANRCYQPKAGDELTSSSCSTTTTSTNSGGDLLRSNHLRTLLHTNNNSIITTFHNQYQPTAAGYFLGPEHNFVAINADPNRNHLDDDDQTIMFTSRVEAVV